jgi:hypothetical protein
MFGLNIKTVYFIIRRDYFISEIINYQRVFYTSTPTKKKKHSHEQWLHEAGKFETKRNQLR